MTDTTAPDQDPSDAIMARERRRQRITVAVVFGSLFAIVGLVIGFALVVNANKPESRGVQAVTYDAYREPWEAAMAKASVVATFPAEPVSLVELQADGMHAFQATFTAEEISALLTMHPYVYELNGNEISLKTPAVGFPEADTGSFEGYLVYGGSRYKARATAPASYSDGDIEIGTSGAELTVEGFGVGGDRRTQALGGISDYLNALLDAAPQLTVTSARIVEGGLEVEGMAPDSIGFPEASLAD